MYNEQNYGNSDLSYLREINKGGMCVIIKLFSREKKKP